MRLDELLSIVAELAKAYHPPPEVSMKVQEGITIDLLLTRMAEEYPERVGETATPEEQIEARDRVRQILATGKVMTFCVGCHAETEIRETRPCVCGGFVCRACERIEEPGRCDHEPIEIPHDPREWQS